MKNEITVKKVGIKIKDEYISLTDIARYKNPDEPKDVIKNWMRSKTTIGFLGLWESINNPYFKGVEFDSFINEAGANFFTLSPEKWVKNTSAIGLKTKRGRYFSGTFAHKDIAFEFASWISAEFKLYLIREYQLLMEREAKSHDWDVRRVLSKVNYKIHTDAIKRNLIPLIVTKNQKNKLYADEADVLNLAMFGMTSKEWKMLNLNKKGNIRDYATIEQLVCLTNLETLNAEYIILRINQEERLSKLNKTAIRQMTILLSNESTKKLK